MFGSGAGMASALSAGLNLCAEAGRFCPHACPLGSLMAHRCVNLQLASVQDVRLKQRQRILLPRFNCRFCIASARDPADFHHGTCFALCRLFATAFALLAFATFLQRGLGTGLKQGVHVCSDACHFVQCFVQ